MQYYPDPYRAAITHQFQLGIEYRRISDFINKEDCIDTSLVNSKAGRQGRKSMAKSKMKVGMKDDIKRTYNIGPTPAESMIKQQEIALQKRRQEASKKASSMGISQNQFKGGKPLGKDVPHANKKH